LNETTVSHIVVVLLMLFVRVIYALKKREVILTPILAWIVGLGLLFLTLLTVMSVNGAYQSPSYFIFSGV